MNVRRSCRDLALRVTRAAADALGYDVLRRDMNSPLPLRDALGPDLWSRRASLTGLELDQAADLRFLETKLAPYFDELSPRDAPAFPGDFELWNGYYQSVDVEVLYAMIRRLEPKRVPSPRSRTRPGSASPKRGSASHGDKSARVSRDTSRLLTREGCHPRLAWSRAAKEGASLSRRTTGVRRPSSGGSRRQSIACVRTMT